MLKEGYPVFKRKAPVPEWPFFHVLLVLSMMNVAGGSQTRLVASDEARLLTGRVSDDIVEESSFDCLKS